MRQNGISFHLSSLKQGLYFVNISNYPYVLMLSTESIWTLYMNSTGDRTVSEMLHTLFVEHFFYI